MSGGGGGAGGLTTGGCACIMGGWTVSALAMLSDDGGGKEFMGDWGGIREDASSGDCFWVFGSSIGGAVVGVCTGLGGSCVCSNLLLTLDGAACCTLWAAAKFCK